MIRESTVNTVTVGWFVFDIIQVVYVTAVMPYVILLILLIRGLFLEGATKGLFYFANPTIHRLADPEVGDQR